MIRYDPLEQPHAGLSLRATHRVLAPDRPPVYTLTEASALATHAELLPAPAVIEICCRERDGSWTWEFLRA